jgi:hypothetical protein
MLPKIKHVCGTISLYDHGHSPCPRGEDLIRQLYAYDRLQYGSSSQKPRVPTDNHHRHH